MVDTSTPAVVLKLDPNVFHHGGLGVVRTLGRLGVPVHVVHEDVFAPAAASRYVHGRWRWTPGPDPARIRQGLMRLADRIGRPAVLIPTDDAGAIFLAEHGDELRRWFLFPAPDRDLPRRLAGKHSLAELCRERAVSCPQATVPASLEEALAFTDRVGLPVFAKLAAPWCPLPGRRPRSTTRLSTRDQVTTSYRAYAGALLLQERVPGGPDWFFHGYCDTSSTCRPSFTGIKERSYPPHTGLTTLGATVANERLRGAVERLLGELRYRGLVDLDLRWDARDGQYKLLDFNPRVGAQFRLFEDAAGLDVVRAAYLDLTGQPVPDKAPVLDRRFVVENYDLLAAFGYYLQGELDLRTWVRSLSGVDETAWFARDDLAPFGLMCLRFGWRAVERRFRGRARRVSPQTPRYRPGRARHDASMQPDRREVVTALPAKQTL
jgi:predicted ATP-grasp superfamily ATP-dependent carboligase